MDNKKRLKFPGHTVIWLFVICVLILLISVLAAENISPRYKDKYSIESSKLHIYN